MLDPDSWNLEPQQMKEAVMPDGNRNLNEAAAVEAFGLNVECCLKLLGITLKSLAVRADIDEKILIGYKLGTGRLTDSRIESISAELGVDSEVLTTDHGDSEAREDAIQLALIGSGKLDHDAEEVATLPESDADASDVGKPPDEAIHELEPVWKDNLTVSLGSKVFDLRNKELKALIMGHIRAAKGSRSNKELGEAAGIKKASSWWSGVERGTARIYRDDLEKIAKALSSSMGVLVTGHGLDPSKIRAKGRHGNSLVPIKRVIELPPLSIEARAAYFRNRVLNSKTEPAEGVAIGELLELARNQDSVDWEDAWLRLTKHGATVQKLISQWNEKLDKVGEPIQAIIIEGISKRFSNQEK